MLRAAVALLVVLAATGVNAACHPSVPNRSTPANEVSSSRLCMSTMSDCLHPDPAIDPNYMTSCAGGGENPQYAGSNTIECEASIISADYRSRNNCTVTMSYTVDLDVTMEVYPCLGFLGVQRITCSTYYADDDYSANNPGGLISTASGQITYTTRTCSSCLNGRCDIIDGCICDDGWSGDDCTISGSSTTVASVAAVALGLVASLFAAL